MGEPFYRLSKLMWPAGRILYRRLGWKKPVLHATVHNQLLTNHPNLLKSEQ